jgi:mannose-6-phosphate isomerase-like protein (cupin superfamily)
MHISQLKDREDLMNPEIIQDNERQICAIIIRSDFEQSGIRFFTPPEFSQQLAYMKHEKGEIIEPHVHNEVHRDVVRTQEVLIIKNGKVQVDLYNRENEYWRSFTLGTGDLILLAAGGHGFTMLEPTEMIEIKQGPYLADQDKVRFARHTSTPLRG